jgi:hypothetical protein
MTAVSSFLGISGALLLMVFGRHLWTTVESRSAAVALMLPLAYGLITETSLQHGTALLVAVTASCIGLVTLLVITGVRTRTVTIPLFQLMVPLLALQLFLVNALRNPETDAIVVFGRLLPMLVWVAVGILARGSWLSLRDVAMILCGGFAFSCVLMLALQQAWAPCSKFKCGPFGELLTGPYDSENFMGRIACLAIMASWHLRRELVGKLTFPLACLGLFATASRSSQLSLAVAILAWATWGVLNIGNRPVLRVAARLLPFGCLALGTWLVYTSEPSDFSNRGYIWGLGRRALDGAWIFGRGIDAWSTDVLARNYMHSEALLLLFSGGAVAILLYAALLSGMIKSANTSDSGFAFALIVALLVLGLTEIAWNPVALDGTVYFFAPILCAAMCTSATRVDYPPASRTGSAEASDGSVAQPRLIPHRRGAGIRAGSAPRSRHLGWR